MAEVLAIIGGGKIGEALLTGLLRGERAPNDVVVVEKHAERADYLQALDPAYAPFAARLHALAQGYHSKNLAAFVARYRTEDTVPPP